MNPQEYLNAVLTDIYTSLEQLRGEAEVDILANDLHALGGPFVKLSLVAEILEVDTQKYVFPGGSA
jgi:hypothetical protein